MEIDITQFLIDECPKDYSASAFEIGNDAGAYTWRAAVDNADPVRFMLSKDRIDAFRGFIKESGGWSNDEVDALTLIDLEALMIQWVSGDLREMFGHDISDFSSLTDEQWEDAKQRQQDGTVSSRIYCGDDGRVYFYIGN